MVAIMTLTLDSSGLYGFHNTYFQPDEKKSGGAYVTVTRLRKED